MIEVGLVKKKETILKHTEYGLEKEPHRTAVIDDPYDFNNREQRKDLLRHIINSAAEFSHSGLIEMENALNEEIREVIMESIDELPFL